MNIITKSIKLLSFIVVLMTACFVAFCLYFQTLDENQKDVQFHRFPHSGQSEFVAEPKPIRFLFFGDMMLDRNVGQKIKQNGIEWLFSKINENNFLKSADIVMANLEGAVTNNGEHYPPVNAYDFAFDPKLIDYVKKIGFNAFTISNNHVTDQGQSGFTEMEKNLDELNLYHTGCADRVVDECSVKTIEITNKKIALFGYSMVYGLLDEERLLQQIQAARANNDLVIVNMHWGVEYKQKHNSIQENLAHRIIDSGADVIIGHHPHVPQDIEIYNKKPIFYSLGNFIFDQYFSKETQEGFAVRLTWEKDKFILNLFPLEGKSSQPALMSVDKKEVFLNWLANNSDVDENLKEQIKKGEVILSGSM